MKSDMSGLVEFLMQIGVLKTDSLIDAFQTNDRYDFVPYSSHGYAYDNNPVSIGHGQTNSQPYTVAFMMELLQPKSGNEVLDVGFGSGWTTAILAKVVGKQGSVLAVEIIPEIFEFGKANLQKYNYPNITLFQGSWTDIPEREFDRILVSAAAASFVPQLLAKRLKVGGRLVIPVRNAFGQSIRLIEKIKDNDLEEHNYPGFIFVPLV